MDLQQWNQLLYVHWSSMRIGIALKVLSLVDELLGFANA